MLCPLFSRLFGEGLKCSSPEETFVTQPIVSGRFSSSSSFSYYQVLSPQQWDHFATYLNVKSCPNGASRCEDHLEAIRTANYVDFDYDAISHALIVKAYWDHAIHTTEGWTEITRLQPNISSIEVGILNNEKPDEPEELKLGGFLTVLGQDSEPKATLFSFPARHHQLPTSDRSASYSVYFSQPTGLHPKLQIDFPANTLTPPAEACALHTYLTLPSYLFIDKYQFDDKLFLAEHNLRRLHSIAGATDLEVPDWVVPQWGSSALFELAHPIATQPQSSTWRSTIPLHLRYLPPTNSSEGITEVPVPWPIVFWACKAEEGLKMSSSPFDRVNLGYDGLFGPRTMFYHVPPRENVHLVETLRVPVLKLGHARLVELGTIVTILLGMGWVVWKLFKVTVGSGGHVKRLDVDRKKTQ